MKYIPRQIEPLLAGSLRRNKSVLLLGPRQTGKTTLLGQFQGALSLSLVRPEVRQRYEGKPSLLSGEVEALESTKAPVLPLVLVDEVQKVPELLNVVQDLVDRKVANFILTGSSARSLRRRSQVNLLPGRVVSLRLDPLTIREAPERRLSDWLLYGALPGIVPVKDPQDLERDLASYVTTYLEEEVRAEAIVRNLGPFVRFLEYAASESGQLVNFRRLSQEIGVSHTTIASYYQILEDCLIAERIEPLTASKTRRKLTRAQKYLFFDLGVRRVAAHEGAQLPRDILGHLFEQFIGLELVRSARLATQRIQIRFWRDPDGPEVDWVIEQAHHYTPIEAKWTSSPSHKDVRHLKVFLNEYPSAPAAYLVCQVPRKVRLDEKITAIPWQQTDELILK